MNDFLKDDFNLIFRSNPTTEAIQNYEDRLSKANEEVFKLRERIKVMEEGNNADVTRIVEERVQTNSLKEINGKIFRCIIFKLFFELVL